MSNSTSLVIKELSPDDGLAIPADDIVTKKMFMLIEGTSGLGPKKAAEKYGFSEQRYYQLLHAFKEHGHSALVNQKTGPKQNSVRTEPLKNQVIRYKFLDDKQGAAVIAQKLRQKGMKASASSVQRVIEEYGLQKKTL